VNILFAELVIRNVTATIVTAAIPAMTTIVHFIIFISLFFKLLNLRVLNKVYSPNFEPKSNDFLYTMSKIF
jgi:hypothetical protein